VVIGRNYNTDQPDQVIREFEDTIFGQDQVVVESQRPERVPFDLAAELHLRFDAVAVAYRKAMRDLGLAAGAPTGIPAELARAGTAPGNHATALHPYGYPDCYRAGGC
jgi:Vanillate O-demethylase oxygenase C-terminal domain